MSSKSHFFNRGLKPFIATFRTTSANESITLPYNQSGEYSGTIDWGDGTITTNTFENREHIYLTAGDYDITVLGEINYFKFRFVNDSRNKIIEVKQWGAYFILQDDCFYQCQNLILNNVNDAPTIKTNLTRAFRQTSVSLINNSNIWNVIELTSLNQTFYLSSSFNSDLSNWNTENLNNLNQTFRQASSFNSDLSNWNTSKVINMNDCFYEAYAFNQDISNWNFSNTNDLSGFMFGKSSANYNATYYDNLLIKWSLDPSVGGLQSDIISTIDMGTIKYTSTGASARQSILDNNKAQTINDGGQL